MLVFITENLRKRSPFEAMQAKMTAILVIYTVQKCSSGGTLILPLVFSPETG
jgi:hypothetical protein